MAASRGHGKRIRTKGKGWERTVHGGRSDRQHMEIVDDQPRGHAIIMCVAGVGLGETPRIGVF